MGSGSLGELGLWEGPASRESRVLSGLGCEGSYSHGVVSNFDYED